MEKSIYIMLTLDRWNSLNHMEYRLASLRPVHGRLALKFLNWVIKQPGLELNHLTHILSISTHILVRARMYEAAKSILRHLSKLGFGSKPVFDALMNTYPLCKSSPSVFDLLIRVYLREGMIIDALETFYLMGSRRFNPSVYTCNMLLGSVVKERRVGSVWSFFMEMLARRICPNVGTFNILINVLCVEGKLKEAGYLLRKMEGSGYVPTIVTYNSILNWCCKKGRYKAASDLIDRMESKGIEADVCTYNMLIDDLCKNNRSAKGYLLLKKMRKRMIAPNEFTYNTLINGLMKEGKVGGATRVFNEMLMLNL